MRTTYNNRDTKISMFMLIVSGTNCRHHFTIRSFFLCCGRSSLMKALEDNKRDMIGILEF